MYSLVSTIEKKKNKEVCKRRPNFGQTQVRHSDEVKRWKRFFHHYNCHVRKRNALKGLCGPECKKSVIRIVGDVYSKTWDLRVLVLDEEESGPSELSLFNFSITSRHRDLWCANGWLEKTV